MKNDLPYSLIYLTPARKTSLERKKYVVLCAKRKASAVDVKARRFRLVLVPDHAQEFPAVPFVKPGMIGHEIQRRDHFRLHIVHRQIQERPGDPLPPVFRSV